MTRKIIAWLCFMTLWSLSEVQATAQSARSGLAATSAGMPTVQVLPIRDAGGLSVGAEEQLPADLTLGLTRRLEGGSPQIRCTDNADFLVEGELSRSPDQGPFLWVIRLYHGPGRDAHHLAAQWIGTANTILSLSFYRGDAPINTEGLSGELAERIRRAVRAYQEQPGLRCLCAIADLANASENLVNARRVTAGTAEQKVQVGVRKAGQMWFIAQSGNQIRLVLAGAALTPNRMKTIICPPDTECLWLLFRPTGVASATGNNLKPLSPLLGDDFVSVTELLPGYGDTPISILRLLDEMREQKPALWCLKKLPCW